MRDYVILTSLLFHYEMSLVWLSRTTLLSPKDCRSGGEHCPRLLNINPLMRSKKSRRDGSNLQRGLSRGGVSHSWHELACALIISSLLSVLSADELGVSSFLPSFLYSLPHSPMLYFLFVSLFPSLAPSWNISILTLCVTALPPLSCLPIISDQCGVPAHTSALDTSWWGWNPFACVWMHFSC